MNSREKKGGLYDKETLVRFGLQWVFLGIGSSVLVMIFLSSDLCLLEDQEAMRTQGNMFRKQ